MTVDLRLLAIVDPDVLRGGDLVLAARAAEAGGATALQLRMKRAGAGAMLAAARRLRDELAVPLYLNDRADVAWAAQAHGVHVGADDLPVEALRLVAPRGFRIGVSVGTPAEAAAAGRAGPDYWSVGSVFATASKADAGAPIGLPGFRALAALAPAGMPVIGIGGITADNAGSLIQAGARGVAVISAIFAAADVQGAAKRIREAVDQALAGRKT
ncbi:MAG: thiamine phosphate synthase [Gemmatimonadetes bacterium]|nr:thiamine phosphate synthase [Gemmatimonadota bacterium]